MTTSTDQLLTRSEALAEVESLGFTAIQQVVMPDGLTWVPLSKWNEPDEETHYYRLRTVGFQSRIERLTGYWWAIR